MIFPGISGGSEKGYVKGLSYYLSHELGYIVGVFHNRGVGGTEYTSAEFADLSRSEEVEKAVNHMVNKF
jgi:predicted alpha/beta-fold hydrolase